VNGTLYRVEAAHFVAGYIVSARGKVVYCAPILRRHVFGLTEAAALVYCQRRRWRVTKGSTL